MALTLAQFLENAGAVNHARDFRRIHSRMLMGWDVRAVGGLATSGTANGGIARAGDMAVSQRGAGANMSVDVAVGFALVGGTESATQGEYGAFNDAVTNVVISASDPTNPRIDVIGVRIRDTEYSGANNDAALIVVTGTPAGAPAVPTVPADFLTLAHVAVAAATATIVTGNITDKRQRISALGGIAPMTSTTRPTVGLWEGQVIIETDSVTAGAPIVQVYNSALATWVPLGQYARAWSVVTDTLLGGDGALQFASIPQTFTHLGLITSLRGNVASAGAEVWLRVNTLATNYDSTEDLDGAAGVVAGAVAWRVARCPGTTANAGILGPASMMFADYRSASVNQKVLSHGGWADGAAGGGDIFNVAGTRRAAAAMTQIDLSCSVSGGAFATTGWKAGSRATLIGIR